MTALLREIQCLNCGLKSRHLDSILQQIIRLHSTEHAGAVHINYGCPHCNKITLSPVIAGVRLDPIVDLSKFPEDMIELLVYLECENKSCESPVILLLPMPVNLNMANLESHIAMNWHRLNVNCEKGFPAHDPCLVKTVLELRRTFALSRCGQIDTLR